ncbi:MAG: hypothetical protein HFH09_01360 [Bacilli bacterium]|nr:hypothetical protein [Bacilli bacterium]
MSKLELKSAFIIGKESTTLMKNFLTKQLEIRILREWQCCERDVIDVPAKEYERVLLEGQKYVVEQNLQAVCWINQYGEAIECGYLELAYAILRRQRKGNALWCLDKYLPDDVKEYLRKMSVALGVDVGHFYNETDRALCLAPQSLDYQEQLKLMKEFIVKEGTGPFSRIIPLTFTGKKQEKESFFLMKVKK